MMRLQACVLAFALVGCSSDAERVETPVAQLGSPLAERELRPLMRRWTLGDPKARLALDRRLLGFINRFPDDPLVVTARVLRAWNALERGDLVAARKLAQPSLLGSAGVSRDLATLVMGAAERRSGNAENALVRLTPLLHKMLDDFATSLLNEELVQAALGARRWVDALKYVEVWQREAPPGGERALELRVRELLAQVPKKALLDALEQRARAGTIDVAGDTAKLIAQQLAVVVVAEQDSAVARQLLDRYVTLLGSYGEAVARLAADTTRGQVHAGVVGALLSYRTPTLRRRSADVASGMAFGLGLPGSKARLVTRDGGRGEAEVTREMAELAGAGAAVIVAGVDPEHSEVAVRFAIDHSLAVVLLTPAPRAAQAETPFVFLLGEDPRRSTSMLSAALGDGGSSVVAGFGAAVADAERSTADTGVGYARDCDQLPDQSELRAEGVDALLVADGGFCADGVVVLAEQMRVPVGLGLGVVISTDARAVSRVLAAGVFPVDRSAADKRLLAWLDTQRGVPTWWHALGHDAAALAWRAVENLEESGEEDKEVKARRVEATSALAVAEADLWTSETRGFGSDRKVVRAIRVVDGARRGRR